MLPYPKIDPVAISLGPLQIRWYGLMYVIGFVIGYFLLKKRVKETGLALDADAISDFVLYVFAGLLIGARVGYVLFYNPVYYLSHPAEMLQFWSGGLSFHGGMIGIMIAGFWFAWKRRLNFYHLADTIMPVFPIGLALGRLGNFINGELYGRVATDVPWAMVFPTDPTGMPRHPSQLYELGMEGILLAVILWSIRKLPLPPGTLFWTFMTGYGTFRIIGELFREPDAHLSFIMPNVTAGMIVSAPMVLVGLPMLVWTLTRKRAASLPAAS